jgi:sugar phosphate isomerase/epimerase
MPGTQIPDLPTALRLLEDLATADIGLIFDTWHFARLGGTTADLLSIPPQSVTSIQVADRDYGVDQRPYIPMDGRLLRATETCRCGTGSGCSWSTRRWPMSASRYSAVTFAGGLINEYRLVA